MTDEKEMTSDELQKLLEQDKAARLLNCRSEIEVILQKHKCQLVVLPRIKIEGAMWVGTAEVHVRILS